MRLFQAQGRKGVVKLGWPQGCGCHVGYHSSRTSLHFGHLIRALSLLESAFFSAVLQQSSCSPARFFLHLGHRRSSMCSMFVLLLFGDSKLKWLE